MADDSLHEEWRPVEGWPYEVSNLGRVRRAVDSAPIYNRATTPGRVLSPTMTHDGYHRVMLTNGSQNRRYRPIHQLVAVAFIGPRPGPGFSVAHWDGDRQNNVPSNLRWATTKENSADAIRHGRSSRGDKNYFCRLSEADVRNIRRLYVRGSVRQKELAARFGVCQGTISAIVMGKVWSWLDD